eukprot:scaffold20069_cov49-Phaeocystis_antarctica.AAC.2
MAQPLRISARRWLRSQAGLDLRRISARFGTAPLPCVRPPVLSYSAEAVSAEVLALSLAAGCGRRCVSAGLALALSIGHDAPGPPAALGPV